MPERRVNSVTVTVVMPTCGRPTLTRAIGSVVDQLEDGDELIVVGDGRQDAAAEMVEDFQPASLLYVEASQPGSVFGNAQRDFGMQLAAGRSDHLMFLDDDDVYEHGALDNVRWAAGANTQAAHVFRCRWGAGHPAAGVTLWAEPVVREQNIATPMVVLPNRPYDRCWIDFNHAGVISDFGWLQSAIAQCDDVAWHPDLIATVRP